ncbi:MAG: tRNA lysidine(34) synthetase TilS [Chloroflexota bacterium]|nr:tRNA lysidine(34) synthetase TilS [Chloroflexota bacterium]
MKLLRRVRETIEEYGLLERGEPVVVGVSGGPDSLCLLHVLKQLASEYEVTPHVAHLEHGIRGQESEAEAQFVSDLAQQWGLPFTVEHADVPRWAEEEGLAVEEAARRARYGFLAQVAIQIGASRIAVGHNADDQTETVLMHFLRGSGLAGLRGMLPLSPLGELRLGEALRDSSLAAELRLIRPLLRVPRSAIEDYCRRKDLEPRFDRSNLDTTYYRNRLRWELLPALESYNPNIREVLRRTAQVVAADYELLRQGLERAWRQILQRESEEAIAFDLEGWRGLPLSLRRSTLREAIHRLRRSLRDINWVHVENARQVAEGGETGAQAALPNHLMLTVGYEKLRIAEKGYVPPVKWPTVRSHLPVAVPGTTELPGTDWQLTARIIDRAALPDEELYSEDRWQAFLDAEVAGRDLILRSRRTKDRFQPLGMEGHSQRLRDFMINVKVPAAHRDEVPILAAGDRILWVCGWREDERAKVTESTQRILWLRFVGARKQRCQLHQ